MEGPESESSLPESPAPDPPPPASPVAPPEPPAPETLTFTGTGAEYFRIWIVNLALTIVTLGVFSAWAKVRRLQYFYRHTRLAGAGFDYHGNPIAILKGRIIGLILFALYSAAGYVNIWVAVGIFAVLAAVMPWLISRSLRFRFHNSSYRGIRFRFHGTTGQAYVTFLMFPILTVLSLFTVGPLWHHRLKRYLFTNAAFGRSRFSMTAPVGEFYVTYILAGCVFIGMLIVIFMAMMGAVAVLALAGAVPADDDSRLTPGMVVVALIIGVIYSLAIVLMQAVTTARLQNQCWNATRIEHHRFASRMSVWRLFGVLYTNLLGTVVTLGLFRPFAQVRLARYVASTLTLLGGASFDVYAAAEGDEVTAVGEETTELFDFDIAF
jgi:uncharacterized membrane protein YjgN (DUF898 family)